MSSVDQTVRLYQELGTWYQQSGDAPLRDRFLVLAADALFAAGRHDEAENIRGRLLQLNPHHLLKPFNSLAEALKSPDVQKYVEGLRKNYPEETARQLLESFRAGKSDKVAPGNVDQAFPTAIPMSAESGAPIPGLGSMYDLKEESIPSFSSLRAIAPEPLPKKPEPKPAVAPSPPLRPASPPLRHRESAAPASPGPKGTYALLPETRPSPWRNGPLDDDRPELAAGAWIAMTLFVILLISGLVLACYTLGRPFLTF
jgi:hypothetical protein